MKSKILYTLFAMALGAALFLNNAGGPGAVSRTDVTNSPLSSGNCNECHGGGNFAPAVTATLLENGTPVTQYKPGEDYIFRLKITANNGTPSRYGFQAVALRGESNQNAGTWDSPPSGTQLTTLNNRVYFEHSSPRTTNSFDIKWKAPTTGSGAVRFYASGNATNGDGNSTGDVAASLAAPLLIAEASTSAAFEVPALPATINAYPNPVETQLNLQIQIKESGRYLLTVHDMTGKTLQHKTIQLLNGDNLESLDMSNLAAGHYAVRLTDGKRVATRTVVKQ